MIYPRLVEAYGDRPCYHSLDAIHATIIDMDMTGEIDEQQIIFDYLDRDSTGVLEFGGNIGRTSVIINKLLHYPDRHVVFESDPTNARILEENRWKNGCQFIIIPAAMSDQPIIQNGWIAKTLDDDSSSGIPPGWKLVPTISFREFQDAFPIDFDTLVVDCEGCISQILTNHGEELLRSIRTIIIEHDDAVNPHVPQDFVRRYLRDAGFQSVVCRDLNENVKCFFEVLRR